MQKNGIESSGDPPGADFALFRGRGVRGRVWKPSGGVLVVIFGICAKSCAYCARRGLWGPSGAYFRPIRSTRPRIHPPISFYPNNVPLIHALQVRCVRPHHGDQVQGALRVWCGETIYSYHGCGYQQEELLWHMRITMVHEELPWYMNDYHGTW